MTDALQFQLCMAPLRGLTGAVFRNTYGEYFGGIDWAVTPFLTTIQGTRIKPSQLKDVLPENNPHIPVVPQILCKRSDNFISLAKALYDLGYETVNWNLGCPFPRVAKKQRGSGLLPHPDLIDTFLESVCTQVPNHISIKLRLGRHEPEEIFALLPVFNCYPIKELIIHPRVGVQMYTGKVDLDSFEKCLGLSRCPVVFNGDIVSRNGFEKVRARFQSIETWMIGRGLICNPFLPLEIKGVMPEAFDRVAHFKRFHDTLFERFAEIRQGPSHLVDAMKGYWGYFYQSFSNADRFLKKIRKVQQEDHYRDLVDRFFEDEAQWCSDDD